MIDDISENYLRAVAAAEPYPYWLDDVDQPAACPALVGLKRAELCIVGGGYTGLWAAVEAKQRNPERNVVLVEGDTVGWGASGRNGGFMESSLTHGLANGQERFPKELPTLEQMGIDNLNAIEATIKRYNIDCDYERVGVIDVANAAHMFDGLVHTYHELTELGQDVTLLDQAEMRAEVNSPTYHGGLWRKDRAAIVDPAMLAWGLKRVALELGVEIYEHTLVNSIERSKHTIGIATPYGRVDANNVVLATNAFPPLLRQIKRYVIPVYDYVLVTEPLNAEQMASIGWSRRQGLSDGGNQFHYYRLTSDNRILWGGYDAVYFFGGKMSAACEQRPETWARLSQHFFTTFPQLEGVQFSHAWGGAIDTCTRFCSFWGQAFDKKLVYSVGYTGLGVAATRFGAEVSLDLLDGIRNDRTALDFVRRKPVPFPPEPLRFMGIQATRWSMAAADRNNGKRNLWLKTLDKFGLGFDS